MKKSIMLTKSVKTKERILSIVGPIFNRNGYSATSLSDITAATQMTKGAIYGNFENKEALALAAFNYNIRFIMDKIRIILVEIESPIARLYAITNFYRTYYKQNIDIGGCPILNLGVDASNTNPVLFERAKDVVRKLQHSILKIIDDGIVVKEINPDIDSKRYAGRIFSSIEGAIFTSTLMSDDLYLKDMMNHLDTMIKNDLQLN